MSAHGSFPPNLAKPPKQSKGNQFDQCLVEDWAYSKKPAKGWGNFFAEVKPKVSKPVLGPTTAKWWQQVTPDPVGPTAAEWWRESTTGNFTGYVTDLSVFTPSPEETLRQQQEDPSLITI